jgi:hypothetical protein
VPRVLKSISPKKQAGGHPRRINIFKRIVVGISKRVWVALLAQGIGLEEAAEDGMKLLVIL